MSSAVRSCPSRRRTRLGFAPVFALLTVLAGGCLDFDAQDVFVHYDRVHDRLDLMLVYRGLYSTVEVDHNGFDQDVEQLDRALVRRRFALWNGGLLGLDTSERDAPEWWFGDLVVVENGRLFRDEQGRLCAYQFIRVPDVKALVQKINAALSVLVEEENLKQGKLILAERHGMDDETVDRLADSLRAGNPLVRLRGAAVEFGFPCSDADHAKVRACLVDELVSGIVKHVTRDAPLQGARVPARAMRTLDLSDRDSVERALAGSSAFQFVRDNEVELVRDGPVTRLVLGAPGKDTAVFRKTPKGRYRPDLLQALIERKAPAIDGVITEATLVERFAEFRGREWVPTPAPAGGSGAASRPETRSGLAR